MKIWLPLLLCFLSSDFLVFGDDFNDRAQLLLRATAHVYRPPAASINDPEKYYWPKTLARLALHGPGDSLANSHIQQFADRSPFHFTMVGRINLMFGQPQANEWAKYESQYIQKFWDRSDSYNFDTGEGSENHLNMSRTSGFLLCEYIEYWRPLEMRADLSVRKANCKKWLLRWGRDLLAKGPGEWNSSTYIVFSSMGWLNLYDYAKDPEVKALAKQVLDHYAQEMALYYSWGTLGGSEMRGGGAHTDLQSSACWLGWLWYGQANQPITDTSSLWKRKNYIYSVYAALSGYRPPQHLHQLAAKTGKPRWVTRNYPSYNHEVADAVTASFYAEPTFTLGSSASTYSGLGSGSAQIVTWKLVVKDSAGKGVHVFGGNGGYHMASYGLQRDPYTQVVQFKNTLVLLTKAPGNSRALHTEAKQQYTEWSANWAKDFYTRFPQDTSKKNPVGMSAEVLFRTIAYISNSKKVVPQVVGKAYCWDLGHHLVLAWPLATAPTPRTFSQVFQGHIIDTTAPDQLGGYVVHVTKRQQAIGATVARLEKELAVTVTGNQVALRIDNRIRRVTYEEDGGYFEPTLDWGFGPTTRATDLALPHYHGPAFGYGRWKGRKATIE